MAKSPSTPPSSPAPWLGQCSPDPAIKPLHKTRSGKKSGHIYGDVWYLTCWTYSELHSIFDMVLDVGSKFGHQWPELVFCSSTWTILWSLKQRTTWKTTCRVKRRTPGWTWSKSRTRACHFTGRIDGSAWAWVVEQYGGCGTPLFCNLVEKGYIYTRDPLAPN